MLMDNGQLNVSAIHSVIHLITAGVAQFIMFTIIHYSIFLWSIAFVHAEPRVFTTGERAKLFSMRSNGAGNMLAAAQKAKIKLLYEYQEHSKKEKAVKLDMNIVKKFNSDPLPIKRRFEHVPVDKLCTDGTKRCLGLTSTLTLMSTVPQKKLVQCLTQKSMHTVMTSVFCFLFRKHDFLAQNRSLTTDWGVINMCGKQNEYPSMRQFQLKNNLLKKQDLDKWRFVMVTRDPVDRFLSGFVDRCVRLDDSCEGCGMNMTCFLEKEFVRLHKFTLPANSERLSVEDLHVNPQSWRCELWKHHKRYTFIRYTKHPENGMLKQLRNILEERDVEDWSIRYIENALTSTRTAHSTFQSPARVYLEDRLRQSPYLMEYLFRIFYVDYKILGYPLPVF